MKAQKERDYIYASTRVRAAGGKGTAEGKIRALRDCGVLVADTPDLIGETLKAALINAGIYNQCRTEV